MSLSIPAKFALPWGANAAATYIRSIPTPSQIGIQNGAASLNDGFPPLCFTPETAGGTPPFGQDFNGILNEITKVQQWQQAGGGWVYDSAYSTAIGGYPVNAILESAILPGRQWLNTVDGNTQNPDVYPFTGWVALPGNNPAGTPVPSFSATVLPNYVLANGQTIGNAGSGGTTAPTGLASATAFFLFVAIWTQFPQSTCTTQFNGATVARGANAAADWTAGRVITTPLMQGSALIGADANGTARLAGVPVVVGGTTTPGSLIGENLHTLAVSEVPALSYSGSTVTGIENQAHSHIFNQASATAVGQVTAGSLSGSIQQIQTNTGTESVNHNHNFSWSGVTNGGGGSHNNVLLSYLVYWNLAL